jgi:uncharacterized protein YifE (UPF0438 family)
LGETINSVLPRVSRQCRGCKFWRCERPLDWTSEQQVILERYCNAKSKMDQGKREIKAIEAELDG